MKARDMAITPPQEKGGHKDFEHSITCPTIFEAKDLFQLAKIRLYDINDWEEICGPESSKFTLTDAQGNTLDRIPHIGDCIKIDIPAPHHVGGVEHDWVQIVAQKEDVSSDDYEFAGFEVRPTHNPLTQKRDVAHFFSEASSSSFCVERIGTKVSARIHGRNEVPNTEIANTLLGKLRNAFIALGAMVGLSNLQWESLVKGFLEPAEKHIFH